MISLTAYLSHLSTACRCRTPYQIQAVVSKGHMILHSGVTHHFTSYIMKKVYFAMFLVT